MPWQVGLAVLPIVLERAETVARLLLSRPFPAIEP
jgi:hypothetical protein